MKESINKIFKNLNLFVLLALILSIISLLFVVEQYYSYNKIKTLTKQKGIITSIATNFKTFNNLEIIKFNANIAQINNDLNKLIKQNRLNYISKFIFPTNAYKSTSQLSQLSFLIQDFDNKSREYLSLKEGDKDLIEYRNNIIALKSSILHFIDSITIENISYDNERFNIFSKIFITLILVLLFINIWYRKRLTDIYQDILFLSSVDSEESNSVIFSQEIDAINMKKKRKIQILDNPNMIDTITNLKNNKGMLQAYEDKKPLAKSHFTSITVLEIDNFSKSKRTFSKDFIQEILKKVAYTISLHEKPTDIIARTDYNQFTFIFSGLSTEQLFKKTDLVRQSISEIKLTNEDNSVVNITATGGFILMQKNLSIEDTIRKSKELLENEKETTTNKILKIKAS